MMWEVYIPTDLPPETYLLICYTMLCFNTLGVNEIGLF